MFLPTLKTLTVLYRKFFRPLIMMGLVMACNRSTYPCPDIHGGTEVVKEGSTEGLKKVKTDLDGNGRLVKKPYSHSKMKRKRSD